MIDVLISNSGDFVTKNTNIGPKLHIVWEETNYPALHISFETGRNLNDPTVTTDGLHIKFYVDRSSSLKSGCGCHGKKELKQRVICLLRTETGEVSGDSTYGTTVKTYKHQDIYSNEVVNGIQNIVLSAVKDLLSNPKVVVKKELNDEWFGTENLNVYVYDGNKEIFDFGMEEI